MVLEKVIDIIAEELSVDPSEITEDSNLLRIWTQIPLLLLILSCPSKMLST